MRILDRYTTPGVAVTALTTCLFNVSSASELEEITVTAQKRAQSAQDVALSIAAFGSDDVARFGNDIGAIAGQVPGVEAYGSGSYFQSFFIRGIGLNEFSGNFNSPVAVHLDEVYVSKNWMFSRPTFDIDRIEILKGPQGTLFGRNTTGGAANYYTAAPTGEFESYARASVDEYSRYSIEGAISGSLTDDLSGRISIYRGFGNGGPQDNLFTGDEHGEPDVLEFRGQLLWEHDSTSIRLLGYGGSDDSDMVGFKGPGIFSTTAPGFCPEALAGSVSESPESCGKFAGITTAFGQFEEAEFEPAGIHTINQNLAPKRKDRFTGGYLRIEHELGETTLTSITAIDQYERIHVEDSDSTPIASADLNWYNDIDVFAQELRLTGTTQEGRLNYVAGLFYSVDELRQVDSGNFSENPFNFVGAGLPPRLVGQFDQEVTSTAAFFNAEYDLNDSWAVIAGGRFTNDETEIVAETSAGLNDVVGDENLPATTLAVIDSLDTSRRDNDFSWRLGLSYHSSEETMWYANLATGFRTGGYSVPFGGTIVEFDPEELQSFEIGVKSDISDTLRINAAAFVYQYEDLQVNVDDPVSPVVPITRNIGESETLGLEIDVTWLATENTEIRLGYSYLDAEFKETDRVMTTVSDLGPIPLQGNRPVNTPENQINGSINYVGSLSANWDWSSYIDFRWVDDRFLEVTNQPADAAPAYTVINASIGLQSADERMEFSLWARNLTDETYLTYINNLPVVGFKLDIFGEQRAIGANATFRF